MKNTFKISSDGACCEVFFNDGTSFLIDSEDLPRISGNTWFKGKRGYPVTHTSRKSPKGHRTIPLHKILLETLDGYDVDHISGNKMDNRKCNLRLCSHQQNMFNQKLRVSNSTGFYGVSYSKNAGKYEAYIHVDGKKQYLGVYDNVIDAADARDAAAIICFGDFARLNRDLEAYAG